MSSEIMILTDQRIMRGVKSKINVPASLVVIVTF